MIQIKTKQIETEIFNPEFEEFKESYDLFEKNRLFDKRFKTVKERTLKILKEDSFARKKKWWLTIRFWSMANFIKVVVPKEKLFNITSPESIFRIQRNLITKAKRGYPELQFLLKNKELLNYNQLLNEESKQVWGFKKSLELNQSMTLK